MSLVLHVSEALGLLGLPVVGKSDGFDLAKSAEAVTHVIFFKCVGETFNKKGDAVRGHLFGCFLGNSVQWQLSFLRRTILNRFFCQINKV